MSKYLPLILIILCAGCGQRQVKNYEYIRTTTVYIDRTVTEESHHEWEYKSNRLASFEKIDTLFVELPGKGKVQMGPYELNNDSFQGGYGPFWMGTSPKGE